MAGSMVLKEVSVWKEGEGVSCEGVTCDGVCVRQARKRNKQQASTA